MKKMDLGQAIGVLANIGVIANIVFLAIEINQNTRSEEISAYQELMSQISRISELAIQNPEAADAALGRPGTAESMESMQTNQFALLIFRHGDMAFYQYQRGVISRQRLEPALSVLTSTVCGENYRAAWQLFRDGFVQEYR